MVDEVTLHDIGKAANDLIHPDQVVWVIVGDRTKVETGLRELKFGELIPIDTDGNYLD